VLIFKGKLDLIKEMKIKNVEELNNKLKEIEDIFLYIKENIDEDNVEVMGSYENWCLNFSELYLE
jgi:flagellar biosynthesis chaperone FliJ